jgi:coproporphyrinogen III oxidase-like Fe-S oxidoreductase
VKVGLPWCTPNGTKVNYHEEKDAGGHYVEGGKQLEMYQRMHDSGCYQISLACESADQDTLDHLVKKNLKVEAIKPAIANAKKAGMVAHTFWIVGYPGEKYEQIERTLKFAENSGADSYSIAILNPLPGTPIYRQVMKDNLWWPGKDGSQMMFRNSLIQVDGFAGPGEFEQYVTENTQR